MSRIGRNPVPVPSGVEAAIDGLHVRVKGPKGQLEATMPSGVSIRTEGDQLLVERAGDSPRERSRHGLVRSLIANMVTGVTEGYSITLDMIGVGYRAALKGSDLELHVGFSHPVRIAAPSGITFEVPAPTRIVVSGIDKALVGQVAADIRRVRPPEPYKGKGIRYEDEVVKRKAGKAAGR
jgi:large subunit ribosomal protein L6